MQIAKNRYSGDLGIVPLDFDKDCLSYQAKKKSKTKDEPDKLLNQCFEEFSVDENDYITDFEGKPLRKNSSGKTSSSNKRENASSYLSDILNSNRTR